MLSDFTHIRPRYSSTQNDILEWLIRAHVRSEETKEGFSSEEKEAFEKQIRHEFERVACKQEIINTRGHEIEDFSHHNWENMRIYPLATASMGASIEARQKIYHEITDRILEEFYPLESKPPNHLIHVSCTGYASPSSGQKIVSKRSWGEVTTVTHAYHMGCYAAIPAIRMAQGFISSQKDFEADIVHTELCGLHINPGIHQTDQIVSQSLFADGFIKYSCRQQPEQGKKAFKILAVHEQIISNSKEAMQWLLGDNGFHFLLKKEIPVLIARHVENFVRALCLKAHLSYEDIVKNAFFAIHPGGPKILELIQKKIGLTDLQLSYSRQILKTFGNMSSGTLPHIWEAIYNDETISNKKIVSLAFGPGLTIAGALFDQI